jgi:3-methyladenine DNA glycosylase AlkD
MPRPTSVQAATRPAKASAKRSLAAPANRAMNDAKTDASRVKDALAALEAAATPRDFANLARFGLDAPKAYGVSISNIQAIARGLGRDHDLALALWETGWYEARLLTAFVDDPARVTSAQMDRWCRDFDNWGVADTLCFKLFDQTPHAWDKVTRWAAMRGEFQKRAGFALLASLAGHDKTSGDAPFLDGLRLVERAADDDRNFVKKGVSWALRRIGTRNAAMRAAALETATRLASSPAPSAKWIGKDAIRDLTKNVKKPAKAAKTTKVTKLAKTKNSKTTRG